MAETVENIANAIQKHRKLELAIEASNPAVGRSLVDFSGELIQFWITAKENTGAYRQVESITGDVTGTTIASRSTITEDGKSVYKNSLFGALLIQNTSGIHEFYTGKGKQRIEIHNNANYIPADDLLATELTIHLDQGQKTLFFRSLFEIFKKNLELDEKIAQLKERQRLAVNEEAEQLLLEIEAAVSEKERNLEKAQSFIRRQAELRYQPILDSKQDEIRRSKFYEGTLAIDGGPGTGKTTSLIQRIKFLIDKIAIDENLPKKFESSKPKLLDQNRSWVFYSPNELLSLYLQSNMQKEGLNPHEKVKVWSQELEILVRQYKLVNTELQRPFLFYNNPEAGLLFPLDGKGIKSIISNFESYYLQVQNDRFTRLKALNIKDLSWEKQAREIMTYINSYGEIKEFESLIRLYFNIQELYQVQVTEILKDYNTIISKAAALTQVGLSKNEINNQKAISLLENWKQKTSTATEEEDDEDEEELEDEDFDDNDSQESNMQGRILKKIRIVIRKSALLQFDPTVKLTPKEIEYKALLSDLSTLEKFNEIGQLAYFKKHFERNTKGVARNLFSVIPTYYKKYRRSRLKTGSVNWNLPLLKSIIERNNNKRLHKEEQAFLLYFINKLIKLTYSSFEQRASEIKHPYFEAFRQHSKPVIAIDEATDFHLIDLLAMSSLSDPKVSSVTYSGDLMQRITKNGLNDWRDLKLFQKDFEHRELEISYRQSHPLLELAKAIYRKALDKEPSYRSYIVDTNEDPSPLLCDETDQEGRIAWIAKRIKEIHKAYGDSIPSIAIFLPTDEGMEKFAKKLGDYELLSDVGIRVKACRNGEVLGSKNTVRVFSVEHIKGLEFEAVFFHDFDKLLENTSSEMLLKVLYVGLSRATFYLALTMDSKLPDEISFLNDHFKSGNSDWEIK